MLCSASTSRQQTSSTVLTATTHRVATHYRRLASRNRPLVSGGVNVPSLLPQPCTSATTTCSTHKTGCEGTSHFYQPTARHGHISGGADVSTSLARKKPRAKQRPLAAAALNICRNVTLFGFSDGSAADGSTCAYYWDCSRPRVATCATASMTGTSEPGCCTRSRTGCCETCAITG